MSEHSFFSDPTMGGMFPSTVVNWEAATVHELLELLRYPCHRAQALTILSKKRTIEKSLALMLWNTFNISFLLIQEVTSIYPRLSPDLLTVEDSNRVCNALTLFQCLASHPDTKGEFFKALMPCYVYPFLETTEKRRPFEHLRLYSLGVIAALLKEDGPLVKPTVLFLIESKVVSMCLRCLDIGEEFTQSVAAMIFARILMEPEGLKHCCGISENFFIVNNVFRSVVEKMGDTPSSPRLLKNVINCYLRMSESPRVCSVLARALPPKLRTMPFINAVQDDRESVLALKNLFENVNAGYEINQQPIEDDINNFQNTRIGYWQN